MAKYRFTEPVHFLKGHVTELRHIPPFVPAHHGETCKNGMLEISCTWTFGDQNFLPIF